MANVICSTQKAKQFQVALCLAAAILNCSTFASDSASASCDCATAAESSAAFATTAAFFASAARVVDGADVDLAALARGPNQVGDLFEV